MVKVIIITVGLLPGRGVKFYRLRPPSVRTTESTSPSSDGGGTVVTVLTHSERSSRRSNDQEELRREESTDREDAPQDGTIQAARPVQQTNEGAGDGPGIAPLPKRTMFQQKTLGWRPRGNRRKRKDKTKRTNDKHKSRTKDKENNDNDRHRKTDGRPNEKSGRKRDRLERTARCPTPKRHRRTKDSRKGRMEVKLPLTTERDKNAARHKQDRNREEPGVKSRPSRG